MNTSIQRYLKGLFQEPMTVLPINPHQCPFCTVNPYATYNGLKNHLENKHPGATLTHEEAPTKEQDQVCQYNTELVKMLLLKRHLDKSIKLGDGENVMLNIKFMHLYFKSLHVPKYALACFEALAQNMYLLSPKMKVLVMQERFVNNLGRSDSNIPMDQDVEFANRNFKENFTVVHGEPTEAVLNRLSKSVDKTVRVMDTFHKEFKIEHFHSRRKISAEKYEIDVQKVCKRLQEAKSHDNISGRVLHSSRLRKATTDPIRTLNLYHFKSWMIDKMSDMMDQPFYKY